MHTYLTERGLTPHLQKVDNECPDALKQFMRTQDVKFQLVPSYDHRQNAAEQAIGTWKKHFVSGLASLDPNFPMHLWCCLIPQCNQTLNLMRPSHLNPRLPAEAQLNGAFNYNKTPLAPPAPKFSFTKPPTVAKHGRSMEWMVGTLVEPPNIIEKLEPNALPLLSNFPPIMEPCPNCPQLMLPSTLPSNSAGLSAILPPALRYHLLETPNLPPSLSSLTFSVKV
jgi:hypothetical protein